MKIKPEIRVYKRVNVKQSFPEISEAVPTTRIGITTITWGTDGLDFDCYSNDDIRRCFELNPKFLVRL